MSLIITAARIQGQNGLDYEGVTLAQLGEAVERAMRECIENGIDPHSIEPKVMIRFGGKIKKISIEV